MLIVTSMYIKSQTPANITGEVVRRPHNQNGSSVGYTIISMYALKVAIWCSGQRSPLMSCGDDKWCSLVHSNILTMTGSTDLGLHYNLGMHQEGVGYNWLYPGGGWDDQRLLRGAPLFSLWGGALHRGQVGFTPLGPGEKPTPPWLPVPHRGKTQIPGR